MKLTCRFRILLLSFAFFIFADALPQEMLLKIKPSPSLMTPQGFPALINIGTDEFLRSFTKNSGLPGYDTMPAEEYLDLYTNFKLKVTEACRLGYDTMPSFTSELDSYREQLSEPYIRDPEIMEKLVREAYERTINEVNASHILVLLPDQATPSDTLEAYNRIVSAYKRLRSGETFESVAAEISDDITVKDNKGNVGWIYAFLMVYPFEQAAYSTPVGEISQPFRTSYDYHIVKVNASRAAGGEVSLSHIMTVAGAGTDSLTVEKAGANIRSYYEMISNGMEFEAVAAQYSEDASTASDSGRMRWIRTGELPPLIEDAVFALKDSGSYTMPLRSVYGWHLFQLKGRRGLPTYDELRGQLEEKVISSGRAEIAERVVLESIRDKYGLAGYDDLKVAAFRDSILEEEYPDLKNLMREYYEGILLFNISNDLVWQKASDDTTGLRKFFEENRDDYPGKTLDEIRGTVIAAYQDYLDELWTGELREKYRIRINKKELKKVGISARE